MIKFQNEVEGFLTGTCQLVGIARNLAIPEIGKVDFYLTENHLGIGLYSASVDSRSSYDKRIALSESQDVPIIHLWEDQWRKKRVIIESRIRSCLGKSQKIHGRQTVVRSVDTPQMLEFLAINHLHVPLKARFRYGLYFQEKLVAMATFSKSRPMLRDGVSYNSSELLRFCNKNGYTVVGGLSKLIAFFIEKQKPDDIMTYRDTDWPGGNAYRALGFEKTGSLPPFELWLDASSGERHYPHRLIAEHFHEWKNTKLSMIPDDQLTARGFSRVIAGGSEKYLLRIKKG
ncbi:MAG: hypothetical protein U5K79_02780 [Cyclobacteriaceae bacterium]|nr:hypothetical protein [Cyclobacteriaceae bacterium]